MDCAGFTDSVWFNRWTVQAQWVRFSKTKTFYSKILFFSSHIYTLNPGRYTVVLASAPKEAQEEVTRFVFRCMAENVQVSHKKE